MEMTHLNLFHNLVAAGMRMRYGSKPGKEAVLRCLFEKKHIMDAGFIDYYLMAFWIFRHYATSAEVAVWPRGAMPSSIICYCLGLTEIDPIKYGLHSVRFVNDELPKFQFDIEASRFEDFRKGAEELLEANAGGYDISDIRKCLFQDLSPMEYLTKKRKQPLPEDIDDEIARYALRFPQTMDLYETYVKNPKCDILIYQEEMLDILKQVFHVYGIKVNQIRLSIQRGEDKQVEAYKKELFANLKDVTLAEAEAAWQRLTSNPRAFLKAHAVSHVLASYKYEF
jgi:DNA polymerase III alpha subunit